MPGVTACTSESKAVCTTSNLDGSVVRTVIFAVEAFLLTDLMPRVASVYVHAYPRISCRSATHRSSVLRSMTVPS